MKPYAQLGITKDFTQLCRHDAYRCIRMALLVLQWLDSHYGIQTTASWDVHNDNIRFYTREQTHTGSSSNDFKIIIGKDSLINEFCMKDDKEISIAKAKSSRKKASRKPSSRRFGR